MSSEVVEPWATAMIAAGFVDPRYKDRDVPSMRQLADAAKTHTSTISHMMAGTRDTGSDLVGRVAEALGVDAVEVSRWVGRARTSSKPFEPHRDADLLTSEEQEAVNELIRLLALPKKRAGGHGVEAAPNAEPDSGPGQVIELRGAARTTGKPTAAQKKAMRDAENPDDDFEPR